MTQPTATDAADLISGLADLAALSPRIQITGFEWTGETIRVRIEDAGDRVAFLKVLGIEVPKSFTSQLGGVDVEGWAGYYRSPSLFKATAFVEVYGTARALEGAA